MIRHVAMMRFTESTTTADIEALAAALRRLPNVIPEIVAYTCGADLGLTQGACDFVVVADFATQAGYRTYAEHPDHVTASATFVKPILEDLHRVQFEF